jgi:sortase (surface protein transpeptidase)
MFFSDNYKLAIGDKIKITDQTGLTVTYTIYDMYYTSPNDASFMERDIDINTREITLQTCNDDSSQRLIIQAKDS